MCIFQLPLIFIAQQQTTTAVGFISTELMKTSSELKRRSSMIWNICCLEAQMLEVVNSQSNAEERWKCSDDEAIGKLLKRFSSTCLQRRVHPFLQFLVSVRRGRTKEEAWHCCHKETSKRQFGCFHFRYFFICRQTKGLLEVLQVKENPED